MKYIKYIISIIISLQILGCKDTVVNNPAVVEYTKILSAKAGDADIILYTNGYDSLTTGYNDVYFKVKIGGTYQNKGVVKLYPKMWMSPTYMHSTPVADSFNFDNSSGYYKGFAIFSMPTSPPDVIWYLNITYTDENNTNYEADSIAAYTSLHMEKQWRIFLDTNDYSSYFITLVKPFSVTKGMNDFNIMLHKINTQMTYFTLLTTPAIFISVYQIDSLVQSAGNINPQCGSDGIYKGRINLPFKGQWNTVDSIFYNNHFITNNPPPIPEFNFIVH